MSEGVFITKFILTSAIFHYNYNSIEFNKTRYDSYDFIVVGAGTAGSLVANRLSANGKFSVLLIDRGGNPGNFYTEIPYFQNLFINGPPIVNQFKSTIQTSSCLSTNGICTITAGNGLGGGSTHNGFVYARGSPLDYDEWQNEFGAQGWSYQDVLPFFKSTETCLNKTLIKESSPLRGHKPGGIYVDTPNNYPQFSELIINALYESGYKIGDFNGHDPNRFSISQVTIKNGKRSSSWNRYLKPVIKRNNLDVITFASVNKINFDKDKRAVSVSYTKGGNDYKVKVSKEVIVSAGTVDSPKILMLSGIGDQDELTKLGINVITNLPSVGKSLQEHPEIVITLSTNFKSIGNGTYQDYNRYKKSFKGRYATDRHSVVVGFDTDKVTSINGNDTKIEYEFILVDGIDAPIANGSIYLKFHFVNPKSRGYIKLKSSDPKDDPIINPNLLSVDQDFQIFKRGIKKFATLINTSNVLKSNYIKINPTQVKNCGLLTQTSIFDDSFLDCFIRTNVLPSIHLSSSCRMGAKDDPLSVVDPKLKLLGGINNVRIIDGSIMPQVTRGNTNAPITMIAEKGSNMILDMYG